LNFEIHRVERFLRFLLFEPLEAALPENGFIVFLGADLPKKSVVRLKFLEQLRANYSTYASCGRKKGNSRF
jgi:hypothetical protein